MQGVFVGKDHMFRWGICFAYLPIYAAQEILSASDTGRAALYDTLTA